VNVTLSRIWRAFLKACQWFAPVGPVVVRAKDFEHSDGHRYDFYGFGIAIRRRPWWKR